MNSFKTAAITALFSLAWGVPLYGADHTPAVVIDYSSGQPRVAPWILPHLQTTPVHAPVSLQQSQDLYWRVQDAANSGRLLAALDRIRLREHARQQRLQADLQAQRQQSYATFSFITKAATTAAYFFVVQNVAQALYNKFRVDALRNAIGSDDAKAVEGFFNKKSLNKQEKQKFFFSAVRRGKLNAVQALINQGVSVSSTNEFGTNALQIAISQYNPDMVALLVNEGADLAHRSPLERAIYLAREAERFNKILEKSDDVPKKTFFKEREIKIKKVQSILQESGAPSRTLQQEKLQELERQKKAEADLNKAFPMMQANDAQPDDSQDSIAVLISKLN